MEGRSKKTSPYLIGGLVTSVIASVCCIGPFLLLATGLSAAWMSQMMALEPYQPLFAAMTIGFFGIAGWRIDWSSSAEATSTDCQAARTSLHLKQAYIALSVLALVLITSTWWIQLFA
ncbi:MAG: hypothetical protein MI746_15230 [Pseudomonadales bacterium]|nr:hypothetical protein [Pseudomonadales bacterium]